MLLTTSISEAKKTQGCAVTYRAAAGNMYGHCPTSCQLHPEPSLGTDLVDYRYLDTLLAAVPQAGVSFTYTHFHPRLWAGQFFDRCQSGKPYTVVNASADTLGEAKDYRDLGVPVVWAIPGDRAPRKAYKTHGLRVVRCPAEYNRAVTCSNCGGGRPLCARRYRDYVIGFTAHGATARQVGQDSPGGCYAACGNCRLNWARLATQEGTQSDSEALRAFVGRLPRGHVVRHHVAGDIGLSRG